MLLFAVLEAAFKSSFIEGETQTYRLDDTTPEAFALFVKWLYIQMLETGARDELIKSQPALVRLWVLAEKLFIPRLQNQVVDVLEGQRLLFHRICTAVIEYVWTNTAVASPLSRFYVSQRAWHLSPAVWAAKPENFPKEMLIEVATFIDEIRQGVAFAGLGLADYHVPEHELE